MLKVGCSWRSWSRKVVHDNYLAEEVVAGGEEMLKERGWENMPAELLREICRRVEEDENRWPFRKIVVACAGVCRSWREAMKDVVLTPQISGRLTFPLSLKQPGPRNSLLQCYIKRNSSTQTFHLYLNLSLALADDGKFLLAARRFRRPTCTNYIISLRSIDLFKGNSCYVGKLRSNFLGTKFDVYDSKPPHAEDKTVKSRSIRLPGSNQISPRVPCGNYPVAHVSYELNMLTTRGPRKMICVLDSVPVSAIQHGGVAPTQMDIPINDIGSSQSIPFFRSTSTHWEKPSRAGDTNHGEKPLILRNKVPRWHQQLQCWCLNFHGRVTVASVKNFQLVASSENGESGANEKIILQFGKVGNDVFTMDYSYPLSAFQAFAICLSSFDTKIACE